MKKWCKHIRINGNSVEIWGEKDVGWTCVFDKLAAQIKFCPICGKARPDES